MTIYTIITDFAFASVLIMISQLIRSKVRLVQSSFIPASLLAGFMGLILGNNVLGWLPFSDSIGSYAGAVTIFVFASVGISGVKFSAKSMKQDLKRMGGYTSYKYLALSIQVVAAVGVGILVVSKLFPGINFGFGLLLVSGFYGGHGTAAAVGSSFEKMGFAAATDLGMTFATAGILTGIFGGLIFIKWATRKGYTQYVKDFSQIPEDLRTGLIWPENRQPMGHDTISSIALDPLAFHLALLLIPTGLGYLLNQWLYKNIEVAPGQPLDLPSFTVAFLVAIAIFFLFGRGEKGVYKYVDNRIVNRLGSAATDYLVFFGVASIKLPVIVEYVGPLVFMMVTGIGIVWVMMRLLGPAMNNESWFERSIFVYGYSTGVFAIGLTLLRIVDPDNKSKTLNDTAIVGPLTTPQEIFTWGWGPMMLMSGQHWIFFGINVAISVVCLVINMIAGWWYTKIPLSKRQPVSLD